MEPARGVVDSLCSSGSGAALLTESRVLASTAMNGARPALL